MKVLSLFTGAGGLDLGLERAGFEIAGCVEADRDCQRTLAANRPHWRQLEPADVHAHRPKAILDAFGLRSGEAALLAGGPPCQPFSKSRQWRVGTPRGMSDPRAETLRAYLAVLEAALPEVMLLENVKGMTSARKQVTQKYEGLDVLRSALDRINRRHQTRYDPVALELDSADFGVPQHRRRVFVVAVRDGSGLDAPLPTHGPEAIQRQRKLPPHTTSWDAIHDLDDPEFDRELLPGGKWAALVPSIPEGSNYLHHTSRGDGEAIFGWRRRYWSFLLKLAKARPSWTIQAQAGPATGPFHWRSRRLSTAEIARLQCFPDSWAIEGGPTTARRQLGNAVPPPISELLGIQIRRQVFGQRPRVKPSLTPEPRTDCPDPEPLAAVPPQYLALRGLHADHPGTGQGPAATRFRDLQSLEAA